MERQLIEEMSEMKGGRNRLKRIRDQTEDEITRLQESCNLITSILIGEDPVSADEAVDSLGE